MWQNVVVRRDGSGILTTLIGEIAGALQKGFRLSPSQLAHLRHLIVQAEPVTPPDTAAANYLYTLHIGGRPSEKIQGPMPRALAQLVTFLSNLMLTYCC